MVLQNKHKVRASRRYNAARGGISDARGRGGSSRGRGSFRGRGNETFPSLKPDNEQDETGDDGEKNDSSDEDKEKYSRRKMESNAWRYREEEVDPHAEQAESEPEVDLSGLLERVAKLDSSRTSKAFSSETAAESSLLQADTDDIDQSLVYLLDRQRERERSSRGGDKAYSAKSTVQGGGLSVSEMKLLEMEGKKLLEERENQRRHNGRAQLLKTQKQQSKVKSINIGDRRNAVEETTQQPSRKNRDREKVNIAALYDDEDGDGKTGHGLDAFLQQLDQTPRAPLSAATSAAEQSREVQAATSTAGATAVNTSPSQRKEHEDFLDSII